MKKLLSLVLVLCLASLASAMIISPMKLVGGDFYNGTFHTVSIEFTEGMSSTVDTSGGGYWAIIGIDPTTGTINTDHPDIPEVLNLAEIIGDAGELGFGYGQGVWGTFASSATEPWSTRTGIYADNFTIAPPPWLGWWVNLYKIDDGFGEVTLVNQLFIIPEPATIALLCLGGLMLRRRK